MGKKACGIRNFTRKEAAGMAEDKITELQSGFNTAFINSAFNSNLAESHQQTGQYASGREACRTTEREWKM